MRPKFDPRPSIRVVTTMPDHPKIEPLSDGAFRALIRLWCWCGEHRTDGLVPTAVARKKARPRYLAELVAAGLMRQFDDGYGMHDFTDHNKTSEEVDALRQSASESGAKGAHLRWHVAQRRRSPECEYCKADLKVVGNV